MKKNSDSNAVKLVKTTATVFIAEKIIALTTLIRREEPIQCILADMRPFCRTERYPIFTKYLARANVEYSDLGKTRSIRRAMLIDSVLVDSLSENGGSILTRSMCYWSIIFEAVRRFVIEHILDTDDLLPIALLRKIGDKDAEADQVWRKIVDEFYVVGNAEPQELRTEIDVHTSAIITQALMMDILDQRGKVVYQDLIPFLTLGRKGLTHEIERKILCLVE